MATKGALEAKVYPEGEIQSDAWTHQGDCFGLTCSFDITKHTDPNVSVEVEQMISLDGGTTWQSGGKCVSVGGIYKNPLTGDPETKSGFSSYGYGKTYDKGQFIENISLWKDPLIKTVMRVVGGSVELSVNEVSAKTNVAEIVIP